VAVKKAGKGATRQSPRGVARGASSGTRWTMRTRIVVSALLMFLASPALAQRSHTVRSGQSLARIAARYGVSVTNLAAANRLPRDAQLRPGMELRVPAEGVVFVTRGDTLASIARDNNTTVAEIRRLNRLRPGRPLRLGQRLVMPGYQAAIEREEAASRWGTPRARGFATFYRRDMDRQFRVRLVDGRRRVQRRARERLRAIFRQREHRGGARGPAPPDRLIRILADLSDHFGGRRITIVSGYRPGSGDEGSHHADGSAVDLQVQGVPHREVRDYLMTHFNRIGVGYYPRTRFVHIDVRGRTSYWIDWSGPGESPRYQRRGDPPPADATRAEVREAMQGFELRRQGRR
jgi:uncharacterized protein YcbK (DUF882 family)